MTDPSILDFMVSRRCEINWYHWQLFLYQFIVLLAVWSALSLCLMSELKGNVVYGSLEHIFANGGSSDFGEA